MARSEPFPSTSSLRYLPCNRGAKQTSSLLRVGAVQVRLPTDGQGGGTVPPTPAFAART